MDTPTYEFREAGFIGSKLVRCWLEHTDLIIEFDGKRAVRIPYQDITGVHLSNRAHGRNEAMLRVHDFRCRVTALRRVVEITNRSDPGVGLPFKYQNHAFNSFLQELHLRLLPFKDHVQFRSGHRWYYRLALAAAMVTAILGPLNLASYGNRVAYGIAIFLAVIAASLFAACRLRPRYYEPTRIPPELLPADEDHRGVLA